MFKTLSTMTSALAVLFTASASFPQSNTPQVYSTAIYVRVAPEKEAAFIEFYKTGAGAKVARARMKADPDAIGWSLRRAIYAGDPAPSANFVIIAAGNGAPKDPDPVKRDELYRAASNMSYAEYMQKVRSMSEQIGQTISHVHHRTENYVTVEGDIVVATRLKAAEGKVAEFSDFEKNFRFPAAAARVQDGKAKGWSYSHNSFPGSSLRYDATEAAVYKDMASAMQINTGTAMAAFAKVFPGKDYARYVSDRRDLSKVVRTDVYRIMVSHRPEGH